MGITHSRNTRTKNGNARFIRLPFRLDTLDLKAKFKVELIKIQRSMIIANSQSAAVTAIFGVMLNCPDLKIDHDIIKYIDGFILAKSMPDHIHKAWDWILNSDPDMRTWNPASKWVQFMWVAKVKVAEMGDFEKLLKNAQEAIRDSIDMREIQKMDERWKTEYDIYGEVAEMSLFMMYQAKHMPNMRRTGSK